MRPSRSAVTENSTDTTPADVENDAAAEPAEPIEAPAAEAEQPPAPEVVDEVEAPLSGDSGSEQPAAGEAAAPAEEPAGEAAAEDNASPAPVADTEAPPPGAGPKILGMAEDVTPPPVPAVKESLRDLEKRERPRRRRLNATQRHRNVFFARLNEFRRQAQQGNDPEAEAEAAEARAAEAADAAGAQAEAPAAEPVTDAGEAPAAAAAEPAPESEPPAVTDAGEAPAADETAATDQGRQQQRRSAPPPQVDQARLVAAIDRAGGPEVIMEALQPKRDEQDQPLKWATVCADACKGLKPSDPVFSAWVRLAATPVSAIKNELGLNERRDDRRGRRGGPGRGRDGGGRGPRREGRGDRVSREDFQRLSHGGTVGANIRIIGLDADAEKKEREARRKAEREAKRQAERDRLARLGY
jgi:hypothetical protein